VRSLTSPLGENNDLITRGILALPVARKKVQKEYLSADKSAMRLEVVLDKPSLTLEAMDLVDSIRDTVAERLRLAGLNARIHLAGATPQMMDTRNVTRGDFYLIAGLALGVIFMIVWLLLRDVWLSAFMVASTVISYFAILGVSYWVFTGLFGAAGLDWKVRVFLFVVMVAVGQDYNIFLAARLSQEALFMEARRATRHAIIHTGPVISSCGLIMAATLGSLMTGDIVLLKQLGFALALGMLVDTFLVRSLVLPAFVALTGRTGKGGRLRS
jgi:RND superfamily putative drug exporter